MGPGLSRHPETLKLVRKLVRTVRLPMVLDADALYALSPYTKHFPRIKTPSVITPHEGEFARLMDWPVQDIMADRLSAVKKAAPLMGVTILLKGSPTLVASPQGDTYIIPTGNAGMASGGVGDVLTGIVAGFLGQNMSDREAAAAAAYLHGRAGDILAEKTGYCGLTAGDIPSALAQAFSSLTRNPAEEQD
jgi:NAD(P)H-hydrate epimerase